MVPRVGCEYTAGSGLGHVLPVAARAQAVAMVWGASWGLGPPHSPRPVWVGWPRRRVRLRQPSLLILLASGLGAGASAEEEDRLSCGDLRPLRCILTPAERCSLCLSCFSSGKSGPGPLLYKRSGELKISEVLTSSRCSGMAALFTGVGSVVSVSGSC